MIVCGICGSSNVEVEVCMNPNTEEILSEEATWCDSCEAYDVPLVDELTGVIKYGGD